jgi:hypothetical protein
MLARRLPVESAWHYSRQPRLGATLANRQTGQPDHSRGAIKHNSIDQQLAADRTEPRVSSAP